MASKARSDDLFNRPWPGLPRRRSSRLRRLVMLLLLAILAGAIALYFRVTDEKRVRDQARDYLSSLLDARVEIGRADLSLFGPLRLDDVKVSPRRDPADGAAEQPPIFEAETLLIHHDTRALLGGQLKPVQIVAVRPLVRLIEDPATNRWNYQRLLKRVDTAAPAQPSTTAQPEQLPAVRLRDARVDYYEQDGDRLVHMGGMGLDGRLLPQADPGWYGFELQSRGDERGPGPQLRGAVRLSDWSLQARLRNFHLNDEVRQVFPRVVRQWWQRHQLSGRIDFPALSYQPSSDGGPARFRVEVALDNASMAVHADAYADRRARLHSQGMDHTWRVMRDLGLDAAGGVTHWQTVLTPPPLRLDQVSGLLVFTEKGVEVPQLAGRIETHTLLIHGALEGYDPGAPSRLQIRSSQHENMRLPASPRWLSGMPYAVRDTWAMIQPSGDIRLELELRRPRWNADLTFRGQIDIVDGAIVYERFPYPMRKITGRVEIVRDEQQEYARLIGLRGLCLPDGVNREVEVFVDGEIGPLDDGGGFDIRVRGRGLRADDALVAAFPEQVRRSLPLLDAHDRRGYPLFTGDFVCRVERKPGECDNWRTTLDLDIRDAEVDLRAFPYPLRQVAGKVRVTDNDLHILEATMRHGDAEVTLSGHLHTDRAGRLTPDLRLRARAVPIDRALLEAIPELQRKWIERVGLAGRFDLDGRIFADAPRAGEAEQPEVQLDIKLALSDGTLWPTDGAFALSNLSGELALSNGKLTLKGMKASRGDAALAGDGTIQWSEQAAAVNLVVSADNLRLDAPLYQLLPPDARAGWDAIRPVGAVDGRVVYSGQFSRDEPDRQGLSAEIRPRGLAIRPVALPLPLEKLTGRVVIHGDDIELHDLAGSYGQSVLELTGGGRIGRGWDLRLKGRDLPLDEPVLAALPPTLSQALQQMEARGRVSFEVDSLVIGAPQSATAPAEPAAAPATAALAAAPLATVPPATAPAPAMARAEFKARLISSDLSLNPAVVLSDVQLNAELSGAIADGRLERIEGTLSASTLGVEGWPARRLSASFSKPAGRDTARIGDIRAEVAGGTLAGEVNLAFADNAPPRYNLSMVLREADVTQLTSDKGQFSGKVTASLDLEGQWGDGNRRSDSNRRSDGTRRGRGDVVVQGRQMMQVPLLLGIMQITNLGLPLAGPFNEATASFSIAGRTTAVESIQLKAANMTVKGSGSLDFATGKVELLLITDNPQWANIPIMRELLAGAQRELMQIRVLGTIQSPTVATSPMHTLTTTVDRVIQGGR